MRALGNLRDYFLATAYNDLVLNRQISIIGNRESNPTKVAIYVIYPKLGVFPSHFAAMDYLRRAGYLPLVVVNGLLRKKEIEDLRSHAWQLIVRKNFGYDFGGYREGILHLCDLLPSLDRLALLNDSTWFPVPRDADWIAQAEKLGMDLAGASDFATPRHPVGDMTSTFVWTPFSDRKNHHYASFALLISERILKDPKFLKYWRSLRLSNDKSRTVRWNERGFTRWIIHNGYSHAATFDVSHLDNDVDRLDDAMLKSVHEHIILPDERYYNSLTLYKGRIGSDDMETWRETAISDILWSISKVSPAYALPVYSTQVMNFGFFKKSPANWNARSSAATSAVATKLFNRVDFDLLTELDVLKKGSQPK